MRSYAKMIHPDDRARVDAVVDGLVDVGRLCHL